MRDPIVTIVLLALLLLAPLPAQAGKLDTLKPDHPRVLAHAEDFERIAELVKADPLAKRWHNKLRAKATEMLDEPVAKYELRDGRRLLYVSREVLGRVETLGLLHRISPDQRYVDRIWADMNAAANFEHWNPAHFLDVAEMGFAFALAYDWLYDDWTEAQRKTMRDAMVRHAIKPALKAYDQDVWWTRAKINWNQVCNGGLICAALAVGDHEPELVEQMLDRSINSLPKSMKRYAPDGGYDEGPGYWAFGTVYNVFAIAALESALGSDFDLGKAPGFDVTGSFPPQMTGPTQMAFNFGDSKTRTPQSPAMMYFAKRHNQPGYARFAAKHNRGGVFDLLWYDPALAAKKNKPLPLKQVFKSAGVGVLRSKWDDRQAWYVGLKGGTIDYGHAQMDLGSFILESQGIRWVVDLGGDDYNLPGYFDQSAARWRYYRNRAEGHNTLVVNPGKAGGQHRGANAPVVLTNDRLRAGLSSAYPGKVSRGIDLDATAGQVRVVDQLAFDQPAEVWWFVHTRAAIEVSEDQRRAVLTRGGKRLQAVIVSPAGARFEVMDAKPLAGSPDPDGQNPNNGATITNPSPGASFVIRGQTPRFGKPNPVNAVRKLAIRLEGVTDERIEVVFENVK